MSKEFKSSKASPKHYIKQKSNESCKSLNQKNRNKSIFQVNLIKREKTGLGFLLQQREEIPYFRIWEICKNGAAESTKQIRKGDLLLKVNSCDLTTLSYEKGLEYIKRIEPGSSVTLTLQTYMENDLCDFSLNKKKEKNGFMSPIRKFKNKLCNNPYNCEKKSFEKLTNSNQELNNIDKQCNNVYEERRIRNSSQPNIREKCIDETSDNDALKKSIISLVSTKGNGQFELDLINSLIDRTMTFKEAKYRSTKNKAASSSVCSGSQKSTNGPTLSSLSSISVNKENLNENYQFENLANSYEKSNDSIYSLELLQDWKNQKYNEIEKIKNCENGFLREEILSGSIESNYCNVEKNYENFLKACKPENIYSQAGKNYLHHENHVSRDIEREIKTYRNLTDPNYEKSGIQIIQRGNEIRINIDGKIEILTNNSNDTKVITMPLSCDQRDNQCYKSSDDVLVYGKNEIEKKQLKATVSTPINEKKLLDLNLPSAYNQVKQNQRLKTDSETRYTNMNLEDNQTASLTKTIDRIYEDKKMENQNISHTFLHTSNDKGLTSSDVKPIDQNNEEIITKTDGVCGNYNCTLTSNESTGEQRSVTPILVKQNAITGKCPMNLRSESSYLNHSTEIASKSKKKKGVKLKYLLDESTCLDTLFQKSITKITCTDERCTGSLMLNPAKNVKGPGEIIEEAVDFIDQFYTSVKREGSKQHKERLVEVIESINSTGSYELKETELNFGARTAWRNAPKCIGRIQWSKLQVFDARYVSTARGMFECICNHLKYVFNKGNIRSAITIFREKTRNSNDFRVWNPQFLSYAGFKIDEQTIIGDRNQLEFTEICIKLGWKPKITEFEFLPLVLQASGQAPEFFEIPPDLTMEVEFVHPKYEWFKELNLKWYCVPGVSSMSLDVGGLIFTACPFNGWYMQTEIARDLADVNRYNKLPVIAERMGLDTKTNFSLWKDKALLELNYSILYSFQKSGVTITDHHSASESFMKHYENENKLRGGCPADWVWIVPPMSTHLTPVFHLEMLNYTLKPSYEYQEPAWKSHVWKEKNLIEDDKSKRRKRKVYFSDIARAVKFSAKLMGKALAKRVKCTILYATETGKSERFAKSLSEIFNHAFDSKVYCMNDYDVANLEHETLLLCISSTFGNGDPPENGEELKKFLHEMRKDHNLKKQSLDKRRLETQNNIFEDKGSLQNVRYSVFGLGNSSYPKFCSFGKFLDITLDELGAECICELGLGDELCGQEDAFKKWSVSAFKNALDAFCIDTDLTFIESISEDVSWSPQNIRLMVYQSKQILTLSESLSKLHNRNVLPCKLKKKKNLQSETSGRVTLCVELNTGEYSGELQYKPGDHIGILAKNRKELVEAVLGRVTNSPPVDQLVQIEKLKEKTSVFGVTKTWVVDERYPACTLYTALTNFLDITSTVTQNLLQYFTTQTSSDSERLRLESLSKDPLEYEKWRLNGHNLVEVFEEFPSLRPNASLLITQLPKLQPRFYSISSSPKVYNDDIHITLGVVEYQPEGKSVHYGVCSKWLEELAEGEVVPTFVRGAPSFRLPEDRTLPIIMVGAGTGLAPFRSFWQERKVDKDMINVPKGQMDRGWGEMILYFGCRRSSEDELYKREIEQMLKEGVITSYYPAYSREPEFKKTYVQDRVAENSLEVYDLIFNKKGHFYICGDVRMAADVAVTLENTLKTNGNMTLDDAKNYINEMKENLRFHEDIFGNSSSKF